nr:hypothetical protein [uncultured Desulfobacter sp.]
MQNFLDSLLLIGFLVGIPVIIILFVLIGGKSFSWIASLYHAWLDRVEKLRLNVWNLKIKNLENAKEISVTCGWGLIIYAILLVSSGLYWADKIYIAFSIGYSILAFGFFRQIFKIAVLTVFLWPILIAYLIYDIETTDGYFFIQELLFFSSVRLGFCFLGKRKFLIFDNIVPA